MASDNSFDIVSEVDMQEVRNAVDQATKEISQRFDFKGSCSRIDLEEAGIVLHSDDDGKLKSVVRVLEERFVKRGIPIKSLEYKDVEPASGATVRQQVTIQQGIPTDKAKQIVKTIKSLKLNKVQAQIQGEQVRVSGKKRDDLQAVIAKLKDSDFGLPLQFSNYR